MTDEALARAIIAHLEAHNIVRLTHCATRVRIQLRVSGERQQEALSEIPDVLGMVHEGNRLQIVVGGRAASLCLALQQQLSNTPSPSHTAHFLTRTSLYITDTFQSLFPLLAPAGLLLGFSLWLHSFTTPFLSSALLMLALSISELPFVLLPFFLTLSASRVLGLRPFVSGMIVAPFLHPNLMASANDLVSLPWSHALPASYAGTITPWFLMVALARLLEKILDRKLETGLAVVFTPLALVSLILPLTFAIIGPVGWLIDQGLVQLVNACLDSLPLITGAVLGASWLWFIRSGKHWLLIPFMYLQHKNSGFTSLAPIVWGSTYAQIGVACAVIWHQRSKESWGHAKSPLRLALLTGITEPILYRCITPSPIAYRNAQVVGGISGALSAYLHFKAPPSVIAGLLSLPGVVINPSPLPVLLLITGTFLIALVTTLLSLYLWSKFKKNNS